MNGAILFGRAMNGADTVRCDTNGSNLLVKGC